MQSYKNITVHFQNQILYASFNVALYNCTRRMHPGVNNGRYNKH